MKSLIGIFIILSVLLFTKTETGKQFWFDVFRLFSKKHNISCSNPNVINTLYKALKENEITNPSVTGITTTIDKVRYKKCTALLSAQGENLFGQIESIKNLPIVYEVQITDDGKNFTVFFYERWLVK